LLPDFTYLSGNPLLGLPLHNSFNYTSVKTFCRLAMVIYEKKELDFSAVQRVLDFQDREQEILVHAFLGLTKADRSIGVSSRRVMIEQIRAAHLPRKARRKMLSFLKQPVPPFSVAAAVSDDRMRDFVLEQVLLGAMLDGHLSDREWHYIEDLAGWLGVSRKDLLKVEEQVVNFYEEHQAYLDLFMVGTAVRSYRQRMMRRLQDSMAENIGLIVEEIRSKGDLADLLLRASSGERLSSAQWKVVRNQLVDVVRSVPSLAIFSLPGGAVLLPLLFKVLPDGLKPRSFAERDRKKREANKDGGENDPQELL
jgi:hypothetical protein